LADWLNGKTVDATSQLYAQYYCGTMELEIEVVRICQVVCLVREAGQGTGWAPTDKARGEQGTTPTLDLGVAGRQ